MTRASAALAAMAALALLAGCLPSWTAPDDLLPPAPVWPDSSTTGPKGAGLAYSALTPTGSIEVTQNGAVLDKLDVSGKIRVNADNVVIKRTRIRHDSGFGIEVMSGARNVRAEYVEIRGTTSAAVANIGTSDYTCIRCDLSGAADGAKATNDVLIESSFIHGLRKFDGSHNDGIQNSGGDSTRGPVIIRGNAIYGPYQTSTSAVLAATNTGPINGMIVEDNFLFGGSYSVYLVDKGTGNGAPTNSAIRNNVFAKYTTGVYKATGVASQSTTINADSKVKVTGNVWDDGSPLQ